MLAMLESSPRSHKPARQWFGFPHSQSHKAAAFRPWAGRSRGQKVSPSFRLGEAIAKNARIIVVACFTLALRLYKRRISKMLMPSCRFYPSCSNYFQDALKRYGLLRGSVVGCWRIIRCNPLSAGGYDPVK